jgi:hypothetical protein
MATVFTTCASSGVTVLHGLRSLESVDQTARNMKDSISKGEIDGEHSYVTRWDANAKRIEVVAGNWCLLTEYEGCEVEAAGGVTSSPVAVLDSTEAAQVFKINSETLQAMRSRRFSAIQISRLWRF